MVDSVSLRLISRSDDLAATSWLLENRGVLFEAPLFSLETKTYSLRNLRQNSMQKKLEGRLKRLKKGNGKVLDFEKRNNLSSRLDFR